MTSGSIDNFGIPKFYVIKYVVGNEYFFKVSHSRVGRQGSSLVKLGMNKFSIKELIFSDKTIKIKDENELFKTLDLDKNAEKVSLEIKKVLVDNRIIDKINNFKYLGNIDLSYFKGLGRRTSNLTHFLYQENNLLTKIITYDNDENEWIIGNYIEEEIKQK